MTYIRLHIAALITGMTILLVGCDNFKNKPGSGGCTYVNLIEEYRIEKSDMIQDTNYKIRFVNTTRSGLTRQLNLNQVKADIPEFNDKMM
jgi:hypothetical protein